MAKFIFVTGGVGRSLCELTKFVQAQTCTTMEVYNV
jgi:hypothetical protein